MRKSLKSFFTCKREIKKNSMAEWSQKLFILLFSAFSSKEDFFLFLIVSSWKEEKFSLLSELLSKRKKLWTINYSLLKLQKRNFYFVLKEIFLSALMILNRITKANFISLLFAFILFYFYLIIDMQHEMTEEGRNL